MKVVVHEQVSAPVDVGGEMIDDELVAVTRFVTVVRGAVIDVAGSVVVDVDVVDVVDVVAVVVLVVDVVAGDANAVVRWSGSLLTTTNATAPIAASAVNTSRRFRLPSPMATIVAHRAGQDCES